MKKLLLAAIMFLFIAFTACNNGKKNKNTKEQTTIEDRKVETVDHLMENAEKNIGKEVYVKGMVSHVCEHSGRRCFLVDSSEEVSVRVEAAGQIKGFNKELSGTIILVKGKLEEKKLTNEYINDFETKVKTEEDTEEGGKHCNAQMQKIKKMRTWMTEHKKDYYPVYFITGESYEIVE